MWQMLTIPEGISLLVQPSPTPASRITEFMAMLNKSACTGEDGTIPSQFAYVSNYYIIKFFSACSCLQHPT